MAAMADAEAFEAAFRPAKRLKAALAPNIFAQFTALANQHKVRRSEIGEGSLWLFISVYDLELWMFVHVCSVFSNPCWDLFEVHQLGENLTNIFQHVKHDFSGNSYTFLCRKYSLLYGLL